eukprot:TRINITY_DN11267_c0_g1_i1.p1 TRINITY_DN11267_c0_g1~~TRINITY_DN11267_c0_g1_i1.p1  ORF type:complete len:224 (+),score=60.14 TRINITY_DN11267_c0_g1_i1:76-672(+)
MEREKVKALLTILSESLKGTNYYTLQSWVSFVASLGLTGYGIYKMDIATERKGFLAMGVLFATGEAFTLAKTLRDIAEAEKLSYLIKKGVLGYGVQVGHDQSNPLISALHGTSSWILQSWLGFALAIGLTGYGIYHMDSAVEKKGFFALGLLFVLNSTFNLAKVLRDKAEANKWLSMLQFPSGQMAGEQNQADDEDGS